MGSVLRRPAGGDLPDIVCAQTEQAATKRRVSCSRVGPQRFWWPPREHDTRRFVAACSVCAQTKSGNSPPAGRLRPLPIPSRPWSHIALDCIPGLPSSAGKPVILTVVARFSKAAHVSPLAQLPSAKEPAQIIIENVFRIHGLPSAVVSDRGPQFTSQFWREFCRLIGASGFLFLFRLSPPV